MPRRAAAGLVALAGAAVLAAGVVAVADPPGHGASGPGGPAPATEPAAAAPRATGSAGPAQPARVVRYRVEVRSPDPALADAAQLVERTLADPRGWSRGGVVLERAQDAPFVVVLAEPPDVDALCAPYETDSRWSCQNGPVVALNADRWRGATERWTGDLATYRQMLVNHEVGHLLGLHHPPAPQCPVPGRPALVMSQQSTELDGCLPNPWPLPEEVERLARGDLPLAPPFNR